MRKLKDTDIKGKTFLVRTDYNVTLKKGKIMDDFRIKASLPTLKFLIKNKCKIVLLSHLGRPIGLDENLRMRLSANARKKSTAFSIEDSVERTLSVYREAV